MAGQEGEDLYTGELIGMLELVWGEGWLSPGGPEEVARLLDGVDLEAKTILDIGCGVGGVDFLLVEKYGAGHITAIDVEDPVLQTARKRAQARGLEKRIEFKKVEPGPLAFPDTAFDIVFSKDAIIHIPDKHALMADIYRVLKPGGLFVASDWLIGHDDVPSPEMQDYIKAEALDFGMASAARYQGAMQEAGFSDIRITSRNAWYKEMAKKELLTMKGELYDKAVAALGKDFVDHNIDTWEKMVVVLDKGEHCPTHLQGRKPA